MTKLTDLSEQELADLLGIPFDGARRWLEEARFLAENEAHPQLGDWLGWLRDAKPAPYLRHAAIRDLMELSVEDVKRLKKTGRFYRRCPYFGREEPLDPGARLKYLRDLLADEVEFEARYPAAFEVLKPRFDAERGLQLPSFGARIPKSDPRKSVVSAGWSQDRKLPQSSADAFSATPAGRTPWHTEVEGVNRNYAPVDVGYLRGVLLAVLGREEYAERVASEDRSEAARAMLGAPARSPVRLTDLRLATAPEMEDVNGLKAELRPLFDSLERPVTPNGVLRWKWDRLWVREEDRGQRSATTEGTAVRVSFAAAALLLFLDFRMPGIEGASSLRLAEQAGELADIVRKTSKSLEANARKLDRLLAYRSPNRPPDPGKEAYDALAAYRMGEEPREVAKSLGITPYRSSPTKPGAYDQGGTREWKDRLAHRLVRGARIEGETFPLAAAVFGNRHKRRVVAKARKAYRAYEAEPRQKPRSTSAAKRPGSRSGTGYALAPPPTRASRSPGPTSSWGRAWRGDSPPSPPARIWAPRANRHTP